MICFKLLLVIGTGASWITGANGYEGANDADFPPPALPSISTLRFAGMRPKELRSIADSVQTQFNLVLDYVASVSWRRTFQNTIMPVAEVMGWYDAMTSQVTVAQYISPSAELQAASAAITKDLGAFLFHAMRRSDLYVSMNDLAICTRCDFFGKWITLL